MNARVIEDEHKPQRQLKFANVESKMNKIKMDMQKLQELRDMCDEVMREVVCNAKQKEPERGELHKQSAVDTQTQDSGEAD